MDPLSAVGLASNILQFVDFAATLVSKGVEIHRLVDGVTSMHASLQATTKHLQAVSRWLKARILTPQDNEEYQIVQIAAGCNNIADELPKALQKLTATSDSRSSSAWKALQSIWEQPKSDELARTLEMYRNNLHHHLSKALLGQQSFIQRSVDDLRAKNVLISLNLNEMLARYQSLREDLIETLRPLQPGGKGTVISGVARAKLDALYAGGEEIMQAADMLHGLRFSRMTVRRHTIAKRHGDTFDWMYNRFLAGNDLHHREWLETGTGVYWATGNAGSGKSTLIKSIYLDSRKRNYLLRWTHRSAGKEISSQQISFSGNLVSNWSAHRKVFSVLYFMRS